MDSKKVTFGFGPADKKPAKMELQKTGEGEGRRRKERTNCRLITFPTVKEKPLCTMQNLNSSLCRSEFLAYNASLSYLLEKVLLIYMLKGTNS